MATTAWVDRGLCLGTGLCAVMAPDVFALDDEGLAVARPGGPGRDATAERLSDIARCCPTGAIVVEPEDGRP
jgi:ferredoxin